jgi:hypothetical protein
MSEAELETFLLRIACRPYDSVCTSSASRRAETVPVPQPLTANSAALNDSARGWRGRAGGIDGL